VSANGFGFLLAALAFVAGLVYRSRLRRQREGETTTLSDAMVRQIEEHGRVDLDDPLDHDTIQEEEARFWEEEPWEEADEW
jgi:hypothetical protein